jgi:hypothetical protein
MNMMNYKIKKFDKIHKNEILKLHENAFGFEKSGKYWDWRFNNHSLRKSSKFLVQIFAHYSKS